MLVVVRGRPKQRLMLTDEERQVLTGWTRRRKSAQALVLRARIVLACAEEGGLRSNTDVAAAERVSLPMVGKWRQRFLEKRLDDSVRRAERGHRRGDRTNPPPRHRVQEVPGQARSGKYRPSWTCT